MRDKNTAIIPIAIRFNDIDLMGHVNNAVYLSYFEEARMSFFNRILGKDHDWEKQGIILVKNVIEYKQPLRLKHEVEAMVWCDGPRSKSFTMNYEIRERGNESNVFSTGHSVVVCFDYQIQRSIEIPADWHRIFKNQ
jgi:acyl-CoA thioester hydrolase